jgi:hypothetical protein
MRAQLTLCGVLLIAGCATVPPDAFVVTPELLAQRQMETRRYDGIDESALLAASANVLQDLGFILESSETRLGVLTASKQRDATDGGQVAMAILLLLLVGEGVYDEDQTIRVSLVVRPVIDSDGQAASDSHLVRVTFQSLVRRSDNSVKPTTIGDPELYQDFHDRVAKSVFLEAHTI